MQIGRLKITEKVTTLDDLRHRKELLLQQVLLSRTEHFLRTHYGIHYIIYYKSVKKSLKVMF